MNTYVSAQKSFDLESISQIKFRQYNEQISVFTNSYHYNAEENKRKKLSQMLL